METTALREQLEHLLHAYTRYFDITRDVVVGTDTFPAAADYHFREENYVATRAHTIYATEQHEYAFFAVTDHLDLETVKRWIDETRQAGTEKVTPHGEHMFSYLTLVILADRIDADAADYLRHYRFRKNFWLTLHGWMEYHIAALETTTHSFLSNPAGKEARKILQQNFPSQAQ